MIQTHMVNRRLTVVIGDEVAFKDSVLDKIKDICEYDLTTYGMGMRSKIIDGVVEQRVLDTVIRECGDEIEDNVPYVTEVTLGDEVTRYIIMRVNHKEMPSGYTISKTMVKNL